MPRKHPKGEEIRSIRGAEIRAVQDAAGNRSLEGLIPYNSQSVDLGGFVEIIAPGAFASALQANADVLCLRDHKPELLMGRTLSKTLSLGDSPEGLRWRVSLPKTQQAEDLAASVDRGDLDTNSFGFICNPGGDTWAFEGDVVLRALTSVELLEISPCSFAAYPASTAALRSCPPEIRASIHLDGETAAPVVVPPPVEQAATAESTQRSTACSCECRSCVDGNCDGCDVADCDAEGCTCDDADEWRARTLQGIEIRKRLIPNRTATNAL